MIDSKACARCGRPTCEWHRLGTVSRELWDGIWLTSGEEHRTRRAAAMRATAQRKAVAQECKESAVDWRRLAGQYAALIDERLGVDVRREIDFAHRGGSDE